MKLFETDSYTYLNSLKQLTEEVVCPVEEDEDIELNPDEDVERYTACDPLPCDGDDLDESCLDFSDLAGIL